MTALVLARSVALAPVALAQDPQERNGTADFLSLDPSGAPGMNTAAKKDRSPHRLRLLHRHPKRRCIQTPSLPRPHHQRTSLPHGLTPLTLLLLPPGLHPSLLDRANITSPTANPAMTVPRETMEVGAEVGAVAAPVTEVITRETETTRGITMLLPLPPLRPPHPRRTGLRVRAGLSRRNPLLRGVRALLTRNTPPAPGNLTLGHPTLSLPLPAPAPIHRRPAGRIRTTLLALLLLPTLALALALAPTLAPVLGLRLLLTHPGMPRPPSLTNMSMLLPPLAALLGAHPRTGTQAKVGRVTAVAGPRPVLQLTATHLPPNRGIRRMRLVPDGRRDQALLLRAQDTSIRLPRKTHLTLGTRPAGLPPRTPRARGLLTMATRLLTPQSLHPSLTDQHRMPPPRGTSPAHRLLLLPHRLG